MDKIDTGYLETFGMMCVECDFYQMKIDTGLVGKIGLLMDEARQFEEFHRIEASKLPDDLDYWAEEINGDWYEAINDWLSDFEKKMKLNVKVLNERGYGSKT